LHNWICGRPTCLQEERQKVPDEQRWGMQLRQELRLLVIFARFRVTIGEQGLPTGKLAAGESLF
jgi:hypothetical protein